MPRTKSSAKLLKKSLKPDDTKVAGQKRGLEEDNKDKLRDDIQNEADDTQPVAKQPRTNQHSRSSRSQDKRKGIIVDKVKLDKIKSAYGLLPLQNLGLEKPQESSPETLLALVYHAMLTSARISHELAYKSVKCLIEAGYHNLETLKKSSWEERTEVLTKGGYTRYREKTATALGELAEFLQKEYDGDLNNLLKRASSSPTEVRTLLQEIKGIGKVGADIFFDNAQAVWPALAPFIDPRSMVTAETCGLNGDVDSLWEAVGKDPAEICRLASALTAIRLEKKEKDFQP